MTHSVESSIYDVSGSCNGSVSQSKSDPKGLFSSSTTDMTTKGTQRPSKVIPHSAADTTITVMPADHREKMACPEITHVSDKPSSYKVHL